MLQVDSKRMTSDAAAKGVARLDTKPSTLKHASTVQNLGQTQPHGLTDSSIIKPNQAQFHSNIVHITATTHHNNSTLPQPSNSQSNSLQLSSLFVSPAAQQHNTNKNSTRHVQRASGQTPLYNASCEFCGTLGNPATCGQCVQVPINGRSVTVHHGCAVWAPQVYQAEGSEEYQNLDLELNRSKSKSCTICGRPGAAISCCQLGCSAVYHLPCALEASDVVLNRGVFELWCPDHVLSESDEEVPSPSKKGGRGRPPLNDDEDFSLQSVRPKRNAALSRKHRLQRGNSYTLSSQQYTSKNSSDYSGGITAADISPAAAHRPRTDWQRRGDLWIKAVPPWWCENKTIHFANKVFRELFMSAPSAILVDEDGRERTCRVEAETRNDMRLQYTLGGEFPEYWDTVGIKAGDFLTFYRNPTSAKIVVRRYPQGVGLPSGNNTSNQTLVRNSSGGGATGATHRTGSNNPTAIDTGATLNQRTNTGGASYNRDALIAAHRPNEPAAVDLRRQESVAAHRHQVPPPTDTAVLPNTAVARGSAHQGVHHNRWMELSDGSAVKTVYKSTLMHQQCPVAGWLYNKLYNRTPRDTDQATMLDPTLDRYFTFDIQYMSAANVHYITGRAFSTWLKDSGIKSGEQIRVWKDSSNTAGGQVMISRVSKAQQPQLQRLIPSEAAAATQLIDPAVTQLQGADNENASGGSLHLKDADSVQAIGGGGQSIGVEITGGFPYNSSTQNNNTIVVNEASPEALQAMCALDALAAAAGYAHQHGTPAIHALLNGIPPSQLAQLFPTRDQGGAAEVKSATEDEMNGIQALVLPMEIDDLNNNNNNQQAAAPPLQAQPQEQTLHPAAANSTVPHNLVSALNLATSAYNNNHNNNNKRPAPHPFMPPSEAFLNMLKRQRSTGEFLPPGIPMMPPLPPPQNGATATASSNTIANSNSMAASLMRVFGRPPPPPAAMTTQQQAAAMAFGSIMQVLGKHQWTPMEQIAVLRFRAKYAVLDAAGREMVHMNVMALQDDKAGLYEVLKAVAFGPAGSNSPPLPQTTTGANMQGSGTFALQQQQQQQPLAGNVIPNQQQKQPDSQ